MKPWSRLRWVLSALRFQASFIPGLIGGGFRSLAEAESSRG